MKKFFAAVFAICLMMSGCRARITVPAGETESSVNSVADAGDNVDNEASQPATNQNEPADEQIITHCRNSAEKAGTNIEVRIEDGVVYYVLMSGLDLTDSFIYMIASENYSIWEDVRTECNGLCKAIMGTVELYGADYDVVLGIMGTVYDNDVVLAISQNGVIIYDFLEEVLAS